MKPTSLLVTLVALALPLLSRAGTAPAGADAAAAGRPAASRLVAPADDQALRARYAAAIRDAIIAQWSIGASMPSGARCRLAIRQLPGGAVGSVQADPDCEFDAAGRAGLERAVMRAQPLPYRGFERVFERSLNLQFTAPR